MPKRNLIVISLKGGGFSCQDCDYKATNQRAMKLHIRVSHGYKSRLRDGDENLLPRCTSCQKLVEKNRVCPCFK